MMKMTLAQSHWQNVGIHSHSESQFFVSIFKKKCMECQPLVLKKNRFTSTVNHKMLRLTTEVNPKHMKNQRLVVEKSHSLQQWIAKFLHLSECCLHHCRSAATPSPLNHSNACFQCALHHLIQCCLHHGHTDTAPTPLCHHSIDWTPIHGKWWKWHSPRVPSTKKEFFHRDALVSEFLHATWCTQHEKNSCCAFFQWKKTTKNIS